FDRAGTVGAEDADRGAVQVVPDRLDVVPGYLTIPGGARRLVRLPIDPDLVRDALFAQAALAWLGDRRRPRYRRRGGLSGGPVGAEGPGAERTGRQPGHPHGLANQPPPVPAP